MNIVKIKERKAYSLLDLEYLFSSDEKATRSIIKALSFMNIVKRVSRNSTDFELAQLLEIDSIDEISYTTENEVYLFDFVGVLTINNLCLIVYPKYLHNYKDDQCNNYRDLKQIISVIRKYQSKEQNLGYKTGNESNFNLLPIVFELIKNYNESGLYFNEREIIELNGDGKILWDKSLSQITPYFSNDIPIYLDLYTLNQVSNEYDYFRRLHAAILTIVCDKSKEILDILGIKTLNLSTEDIENFGSKDFIIYKINQEISKQFVTSRQEVLKLIKNYLLESDIDILTDSISFVGTTSFNMIWEDVCSVYLNDVSKKSIKQLGYTYKGNKKESFLLSNVIEKPMWTHNKTATSHLAKGTLIPDIMTIKENNFAIYDAKYYSIVLNENELKKNPGVSDVTKQYLYELSYRGFLEENKLNMDRNAFLMPTEYNERVNLGIVSMEIFEGLKDIEIDLIPSRKAFAKYLNN